MKYVLLLSLAMFAFACDQKPKTPPTSPTATTQKTPTPKTTPKTTTKTTTLTIPKDGKSFKPPVAKDKIPQGAFFCDMGTVHYARMDKGDGKCPLCGMVLVKKGTKVEPKHDHKANHDHHNHKH